MAERKLQVTITGNAKSAQKAFGQLNGSAKKSEGVLSSMSSKLVAMGGAALVWKAFDGWNESQKILRQTEAVITSTGSAANVTAGQVGDLAKSISMNTGIHDEAIQSGANLLLTFKNIRNEAGKGNDIFDQTTQIMTDVSVAMGQDTKQSAIQLGKALNDPVKGITALSRVGITFTDQQKQQIKALQESGDLLGAQKIILQELESQFGGSAEAQATAMDKAKVSVSNMSDEIMGVLAPAIETAASGVAALTEGFSSLPQPVQNVAVGMGALALAAPKLKTLAVAAGDLGTRMVTMAQNAVVPTRAVEGLGSASGKAAPKVSRLSSASVAGGIAMGTLAVAAYAWTKNAANAAKRAADVEAAIDGITGAAKTAGKSLERAFAEDFLPELVRDFPDLQGVLEDAGSSLGEFRDAAMEGRDAFAEYVDTLGLTPEELMKFGPALDQAVSGLDGARVAARAAAAANRELGNASSDAEVGVDGLVESSDDAAGATGTAATAADRNSEALAELKRRAEEATSKIQAFYDAQTAGLDAQIGAEQAIDDLTAAFAENGATLDINEQAGRDNLSALIGMKDAALESAMATREQTGSTAAATNEMNVYRLRLIDAMVQAGFTEGQVNSMIEKMGLTPTDINTTFHTNATAEEQKAKDFKAALDRIPPIKGVQMDVKTDTATSRLNTLQAKINAVARAAQSVMNGGTPPGRAEGGPVTRGRPYVVGEVGPELFVPNASGTIIPNDRMPSVTRSGATGGSLVVNVSVGGSIRSDREVAEVVRNELIDIGRRTGRPVLAGLA